MKTPFNGWESTIAIQAETAFNAASAEPVYTLTGKTRFTKAAQLHQRSSRVNVFRQESAIASAGTFYQGSFEVEFGFNAVVRNILQALFHKTSETTDGDYISATFQPIRVASAKSLKLGIEYGGGPYIRFDGVTVDSINLSVRILQTPRLVVNWKGIARTTPGAPDVLGDSPEVIPANLARHVEATVEADSIPMDNLTEISFAFSQLKTPAQFDKAGAPSRFTVAPFEGTCQFSEMFGPDSFFPNMLAAQVTFPLSVVLLDPAGTEKQFALDWPSIQIGDGEPDGTGNGDLNYRANAKLLLPAGDSPTAFLKF